VVHGHVIGVVFGVGERAVVTRSVHNRTDGPTTRVAIPTAGTQAYLVAENSADIGVVGHLVKPVMVGQTVLKCAVAPTLRETELIVDALLQAAQYA
jgi:hypothetical protein